jgi:hypothetical protein
VVDEIQLNKWRCDDEKREETLELNLSKCENVKMRNVSHILPDTYTITHLSSNVFNEMYKLKKLSLANNHLTSAGIAHNVFQPLRNLECLILTNNKLTSVDDHLLQVSKELKLFFIKVSSSKV